jgi:hypothetical protein
MNDLATSAHARPQSRPAPPVRRTLTLACAVVAIGTATLFVLSVNCAVYLALSGEPPSLAVVLQQAPRWICGLLRACSA